MTWKAAKGTWNNLRSNNCKDQRVTAVALVADLFKKKVSLSFSVGLNYWTFLSCPFKNEIFFLPVYWKVEWLSAVWTDQSTTEPSVQLYCGAWLSSPDHGKNWSWTQTLLHLLWNNLSLHSAQVVADFCDKSV